ncbi:hypothetical protein [Sinomicrobium sp. M5D2P17]
MKTRFFYCIVFFLSIGLAACSDGEDGIDGIDGEQGEQGPQGPSGEDGNANIVLYEFGEQTFTNLLSLELSVSTETVDNSLIMVYYNPSNENSTAWYSVPGLGSNNSYQTRFYIYQTSTDPSIYTLAIRTLQPDGSGSYGSEVNFTRIKVIFAEASSIQSAKTENQIDLRDYKAVKDFYGLQD